MDREISTLAPNAPLRVLYCTDTYPPQVNGVSVITSLTVSGLVRRGWECGVVAPAYPGPDGPSVFAPEAPTRVVLATLPSVALPVYPDVRIAVPDYWRVARAIERFAPDLVHCQTEFVVGRLGQIAAHRAGIPTVSSFHTNFGSYTGAYGAPWLRPVVSAYLGRFHRRSRLTFTPSRAAKSELTRMGVHRVEVWGRGVDIEQFNPRFRSDDLRQSYGIPSTFHFLHVGRLASEKGVDRLLEAYRIARGLIGPETVHLIIAGSGPQEDALRRTAPDGVTFLGNLDRERALPRLFASCDAFVFSSLTETLGLVILEAMASGLPVIAVPEGGVSDHLRHGINGLGCPAGDVTAMAEMMVRVARDQTLQRRLAQGARATAVSLDWSAELDRLDWQYRDVLGQVRTEPGSERHSA
jgi:glycosyltransferase involved in cell wall biosynthesis